MTSRAVPAVAAALLTLGSWGCGQEDQPMAPDETQAFVEAAPDLSFQQALASLALTDEEAARLGRLAEDLHAAMVDTRRAMEELAGLDGDERAAAHEVLRADMIDLRTRHEVFMESLTLEQRESFMDHVRAQIEDHEADHSIGHGLHSIGHEDPDGS